MKAKTTQAPSHLPGLVDHDLGDAQALPVAARGRVRVGECLAQHAGRAAGGHEHARGEHARQIRHRVRADRLVQHAVWVHVRLHLLWQRLRFKNHCNDPWMSIAAVQCACMPLPAVVPDYRFELHQRTWQLAFVLP